MSSKRQQGANHLAQATQEDSNTHIDELGSRQLNPPRVNKTRVVNHIDANRGTFNEGKHLKFSLVSHSNGPYNYHLMIRVDTGADVNCMNEITFHELFPEVKLSVCPHEIQNFRNSTADISILGLFCIYLQFKWENIRTPS